MTLWMGGVGRRVGDDLIGQCQPLGFPQLVGQRQSKLRRPAAAVSRLWVHG